MYFPGNSFKKKLLSLVAIELFLIVPINLAMAQLKPPTPEVPLEINNDSRYFSVEWESDPEHPEAIYELEQSGDISFEDSELIYRGHDRASFISGLPNGTYYFRIRKEVDGEKSSWSEPIRVEVKHHSLYLAFSLATVGVIVFALTAGIIIKGVRTSKI